MSMLLEATNCFLGNCGRVAQLGERHAYTVDVTGSSPVPPTIDKFSLKSSKYKKDFLGS